MLVFDVVFVRKFICPKFLKKRPNGFAQSFFSETFPSESFRFNVCRKTNQINKVTIFLCNFKRELSLLCAFGNYSKCIKTLFSSDYSSAWLPYDRNSRRRFGDVCPISRRHMEMITVMIIWKPRFKLISTLSMRPCTVSV